MSSTGRNEVCGVQSYMVCYTQGHSEPHAANKTPPHLQFPVRAAQGTQVLK
jgi:hypothetical protein